jgi:Bacterial protein of unknown function (Gcw_chp)
MKAFISYSLLLTVLIGWNSGIMLAQSNKFMYDSTGEKSQVRASLKYTSDYIYMGRSDSAKAPYLSPAVTYYHKSGFFLHSSLSFLTAKGEGRLDMMTLAGGYDYYRNNLTLGVSLSQYFFSDESYNVLAEMSTYLNGYVGYDFRWFNAYVDASLGFSENTDLFLGAELNRTFYLLNYKLLITPAVYMNAGSQEYYSQYYTNRSTQTGAGKGNGKMGSQPPVSTQNSQTLASTKFQFLDYEAGLNLTYKIQKIRLFGTGTWTFPVNPATIVTDSGEYEEELKNGFFWSTGVRVIF